MDQFWLGLALKMATSAGVVVVASKLVEVAGPFLGAMVATLPVSAGPAYVFLAVEHSPAFLEQSSLSSFAVDAGTAWFILLYVRLADRGVPASVAAALGSWALMAALIAEASWSFAAATLLNAVSWAACFLGTRRQLAVEPAQLAARRRRWDLPVRAFAVMTVVAAVVLTGRLLGPRAAGIAALIPVVLTSLAVVLHMRLGAHATGAVLANAVPGMIGFTTALGVLHQTVTTLGSAAGLSVALGVCISWNLGLILRRHLARRRPVSMKRWRLGKV